MTWQQIPFVRLFTPFLFGICCFNWWGAKNLPWLGHLGVHIGIISLLIGLSQKQAPTISTIRIWGAWLMLSLFQVGYLMGFIHDSRNYASHIEHFDVAAQATYLATVISTPKMAAKSIRTTLQLESIRSNQTSKICTGVLLAYFQLDTNSVKLQYGDKLVLKTSINPLKAPLNPKAFDSKNYYASKNIYHQTYLPSKQWKKIASNQGNPFYQLIYQYKISLLEILAQHLPSPNEYAVASALILGAKDQLNKEIKNAYADTGAMHVLAVSGLHIGILVGLLSFLLSFIKRSNQTWQRTKNIILLLILWSFALLTGGSSSVLRACTMFSFVLIGQFLGRKINIYNSLAASAFLLLCINPFMLFDLGFQLSYLALIGIIYLHPKIYKQWYIENKLGDWIWNGLALSIAAQIATLPISLYYFHQFPLFFWLSGIVVTAAAGFILGIGLCLLALNFIPILNTFLGYLLYASIWLMNSLIFVIQQIPGAVWDGFWLDYWQMWAWYLVIISSIYLLIKRQLKWAFIPLGISCLLYSHRAFIQFQQTQQHQLCIYNCRKSTLFSYINGRQCTTWSDSSLVGSPQMVYAQQNHLWSLGIIQNTTYYLEDTVHNNTIFYQNKKGQFSNKRLCLYNQSTAQLQSHTPLDVDYVLVHGNPQLNSIQQIEDLYLYKKLIFDASNSSWSIKKWIKECKELNIDFIDVSSEGAWILDL